MPTDPTVFAAWGAIGGATVGALLSQRGARRVAAEDRVWSRRSDAYVELLEWLDEDFESLRGGRVREPFPGPLLARLTAYGSMELDGRVTAYRRVRDKAVADRSDAARARVEVAGVLLRLRVRVELDARPMRAERWITTLLGTRAGTRLMLRFRKRSRDMRPYVERDADLASACGTDCGTSPS